MGDIIRELHHFRHTWNKFFVNLDLNRLIIEASVHGPFRYIRSSRLVSSFDGETVVADE